MHQRHPCRRLRRKKTRIKRHNSWRHRASANAARRAAKQGTFSSFFFVFLPSKKGRKHAKNQKVASANAQPSPKPSRWRRRDRTILKKISTVSSGKRNLSSRYFFLGNCQKQKTIFFKKKKREKDKSQQRQRSRERSESTTTKARRDRERR